MVRKGAEDSASKPRLIDRQNRVALPPEVMEKLGVAAGDYVAFHIDAGEVRVRRVKWSLG